jgi:hypothetical protein
VERDAPVRDDDLQVVVLGVRTHVEAGAEIFGHAPARAHEEGTAGVVPDDEVRLSGELEDAIANAELARHAQAGAHAQEHPTAIRKRELQALAVQGDVFAERLGVGPEPPDRDPGGEATDRRRDADDPEPLPGTRQRSGPRGEPGRPLRRVTAAAPQQSDPGLRDDPAPCARARETPDGADLVEQLAPPRIGGDPRLDRGRLVG